MRVVTSKYLAVSTYAIKWYYLGAWRKLRIYSLTYFCINELMVSFPLDVAHLFTFRDNDRKVEAGEL